MLRKDNMDKVYRTAQEKYAAVIIDIKDNKVEIKDSHMSGNWVKFKKKFHFMKKFAHNILNVCV